MINFFLLFKDYYYFEILTRFFLWAAKGVQISKMEKREHFINLYTM